MLILIGNTTIVHSIELVTKVRVRLNSGRAVPQLATTLAPKLRRLFGSSLDLRRATTQSQLATGCQKFGARNGRRDFGADVAYFTSLLR